MELEDRQSLHQAQIEYVVSKMDNLASQWIDADLDLRLGFQKMVFPEGLLFNTKERTFGTDKSATFTDTCLIKKTFPKRKSLFW